MVVERSERVVGRGEGGRCGSDAGTSERVTQAR